MCLQAAFPRPPSVFLSPHGFWSQARVLAAGVCVLLSLVLCPGAGSVLAQERAAAQGHATWVADELLVGVHRGISRPQAQALYWGQGAALAQEVPQLNLHRIRVPAGALETIQQALSRRPEVQFVEKNYLLPPDFVPNDPAYGSEWHLAKISAPQAWTISQGVPGVIIAILDSGIDATHPDLAAKLVPGYNFFDNNTNTADVYGHGTLVAGAAAALSNNGTGVASVAWQNLLMPVRVTDTNGYGSVLAIAQGLTWAVDHGAKVMNLSFTGIAGISTITSAAQYVVSQGGLVVAAAGNCGCLDSTAENPYILSVSATDTTDTLASFSSRGPYVDMAAPGVSIVTTTAGGGYGGVSGTSFSSPIAAGVVALMMSVDPALTPTDIETLLEATTDDLGVAGYDSAFGFGRVNAYKALRAAGGSSPPLASDTTAPTAAISSPANTATVAGTINVSVVATDEVGVAQTELYLDSALFATTTAPPFSFAWNTTQASGGGHTLQAMAYDAAGNRGASAPVTVTVNNIAPDTLVPTVSILSPTPGSKVATKTLKLKVRATDNVQVRQIEVSIDGRRLGTASCSASSCSSTFSWNTKSATKGGHTLSAKAYDAAGNMAPSSPVTVYK
jgi:thermitase